MRRGIPVVLLLGALGAAPVAAAESRPHKPIKSSAASPTVVTAGPTRASLEVQVESADLIARSLEGTFALELSPASASDVPAGSMSGRWRATLSESVVSAGVFAPQPVLELIVVPEAQAKIDGRDYGRVSAAMIPVAAGRHALRLEHPDYQAYLRRITLLPGQTQRVVVDLAEEAIPRKP